VKDFTAKGGWWVVAQVVLFVAISASWVLDRVGWGPVAVGSGGVLALAGVVLGGSGLFSLGRHLSPYPTPRPDAVLVDRGPYRLVRHPIYGGIVLGSAGISLADGSWVGLLLAAVLVGLFWEKTHVEESRLVDAVSGYEAYRRRVRRRLIPGLF
jgi:protein-S-isoprenylcysteine O-methyltransferase Ste14